MKNPNIIVVELQNCPINALNFYFDLFPLLQGHKRQRCYVREGICGLYSSSWIVTAGAK